MKHFKFGQCSVTIIDKSNHEARKERLKEPLERFFKEIKKGKKGNTNEFENQNTSIAKLQRH